MFRERLFEVNNNIKFSCEKVGRKFEDVTLIAVSKTKPIEMIEEYYNLGLRNFGENKVQELCDKKKSLYDDIKWHFIGHLQTNKVKKILSQNVLIHSVDSIKLIDVIEEEAHKMNIHVNALLEFNIAEEESKYGFYLKDLDSVIERVSLCKNLHIEGLMTIAPFVDDPNDNRDIFRTMNNIFVDISNKNIDNIKMNILSMGMSNDYQVAIEEGATMVRIGTDLFGERDYLNNK